MALLLYTMNSAAIPIVIPVYNPPIEFEPFILALRKQSDAPIIIVNDGSNKQFSSLFHSFTLLHKTILLSHSSNKGKGAALKTAMRHVQTHSTGAYGIITADADGQHVPIDIVKCSTLADKKRDALFVGTRVDRLTMPIKSRTGNAITRSFLKLLHNTYVGDTQSGLRYIPNRLMQDCLTSVFDKYDFELDMLIRAAHEKISIVEFPIETIYLNRNKASHFKAFKDSWYVARVFIHHLGW